MQCPRCHAIGTYLLNGAPRECFVCGGDGWVNVLEWAFYRLVCLFRPDFHRKA